MHSVAMSTTASPKMADMSKKICRDVCDNGCSTLKPNDPDCMEVCSRNCLAGLEMCKADSDCVRGCFELLGLHDPTAVCDQM